MLERYCLCDVSGRVVQVGTCAAGTAHHQERDGLVAHVVNARLGDMVVDGCVVGKDLGDAKREKRNAVNLWRDRENGKPIEYGGFLFDADEKSQRAINSWNAVIACGHALPPGFFWRDRNNIDRPADADFVRGLAAALALRGTEINI